MAKRISNRAGWSSPNFDLSLSEHIRAAIKESKLSVYRIAQETGVDQSTLNKFVKGTRRNVRLDVADRLFTFFFHAPRRKLKASR